MAHLEPAATLSHYRILGPLGQGGQATAYKIGMIKIQELRAMAQKELGPKFTMAGFHDTVLGGGALVLGAVFLWYAWKLLDPPDEFFAMRAFKYSIIYLMALFAFLLIDHWLMPSGPAPSAQALEFMRSGN